MNIDGADLHDALAPLMGDPVADADRVLKRLPPPPLVPPIGWWLLAAGLLCGGLLGWWWAAPTAGAPVEGPPTKVKGPANAEADRIMYYGMGEVTVTEPIAGRQTLQAGEYLVEMGARFETGTSAAGMLMAYDIQLRLDRQTRASVESPRRIGLHDGRLWVWSGREPDSLVVVGTPRGPVDVLGGSCDIGFREGRLRVLCLSGTAELQLAGAEPLRLTAGTMAEVSATGRVGPKPVAFPEAATAWMTRLVLRQQDRGELSKRIAAVVRAYFVPDLRPAAQRELRRIGADAVPALIERLQKGESVAVEIARELAELIGNMAGTTTVDYLFQLLDHTDGEVRVIAYTHIRRITGEDLGLAAAFWRDPARRVEHLQTARRWWERTR